MLEDVKHVILILSGKGGVGKSTISTQLALTLKEQGFKVSIFESFYFNKNFNLMSVTYIFFQVGLLDVDLCGPSVPYLLQLEGKDIHQADGG